MLIAAGRLESDPTAAARLAVPVGGSIILHGLVLLAWMAGAAPRMPAGEAPPIEVELVQQMAQKQGAAPVQAAAPAAAAPPSLSQSPAGKTAPALPPPLPRPAKPAPEVNLGTGSEDIDPLSVTSKDMIPPAPDSRFRNLPPHYPAEAGRIGAEGIVQLLIHVTSAGLPAEVVVAHSSGYEVLDDEARRAVRLWRFRPARHEGEAVPYDYLLNIRFSLGDR